MLADALVTASDASLPLPTPLAALGRGQDLVDAHQRFHFVGHVEQNSAQLCSEPPSQDTNEQ